MTGCVHFLFRRTGRKALPVNHFISSLITSFIIVRTDYYYPICFTTVNQKLNVVTTN